MTRLQSEQVLRTAAHVAYTFPSVNPLTMLEERDPFRWAVLVAAHNVIVTEQNEANEKANRQTGGGPRVAGSRRR